MKVAIITDCYPQIEGEVLGGVAGACYYLVESLRNIAGVTVDVVHYNSNNPGIKDSGYHCVASSGRKVDKKAIVAALKLISPDIVHVQANASVAAYLTEKLAIPVVLTIHGFNEDDTLFRHSGIMKYLYHYAVKLTEVRARKKIKNLICINPYVRSRLSITSSMKAWDICNPVADSFFDINRQPVPRRILSVGRISPLKNTCNLIKAFSLFSNACDDCRLVLAGDGIATVYGKKCQKLVSTLGISEKVQFPGNLSISELQGELAKANCLVLASLQENAPLAISEAMAAGVPVVASNICGIPWMVDEGVTGYLVDPDDVADIASGIAMGIAIDEKVSCNVIKEIAGNKYSSGIVAQSTLNMYSSILSQS